MASHISKKKKITDIARQVIDHKFMFDVLVISGLVGLYYIIFARPLFLRKYTFGGDTHFYWSLNYISLLSLKNFNSLPWWDPTVYNGYPLYYHFISGWSNYLGPFYLPSLILFKTISSFVSINTYIIFHRTLYVVTLNIIAVYLISRELVVNRAAAVLPALIFTFSYFQVLNFHDFYAMEAMIAPLFYLYALIRYNNKRTGSNLLLLFLFISLYLASLENGIIMSAIYWSSVFTFLLLLFNPGLIKDTFNLLRGLTKTRKGKIMVSLSLFLVLTALLAAWLPPHYNLSRLIKYRGGVVDYTSGGGLTNHPITIEKSRIWTIVSNWLPFPGLHDKLLKYGWNGHDYRYIGLLTLPLLIAAITLGLKNRYVFILLLSYFLCNGFIIYTTDNIVYGILTDSSDLFRNVRNMASIFPRGGPLLFLIFLSGIGLDYLLGIPDNPGEKTDRDGNPFDKIFIGALKFLMLCAFAAMIGAIAVSHPKIMPDYLPRIMGQVSPHPSQAKDFWLRHTLFHVGFYLLVFSFICWILSLSKKEVIRRSLLICLFIFVFTDLTISISHNIDRYPSWIDFNASYDLMGPHVGRVPYRVVSEKNTIVPDDADLVPARSEDENMFRTNYTGVYHNPWGIMWGIKEWLVLATRKEGLKFLPNWNPETFRMKKYPEFKFFSNGYYLPFEAIKDIDKDDTIFNKKPLFYLHDEKLAASVKVPPQIVDGSYKIEKFTFNKVLIKTSSDQDSFLCFLDNYDRFWSAYIDGEEAEIYRANFCFKAIRLPAGKHEVSWVYNPYPIKIAYLSFYLLLAFFLVYYIAYFRTDPKSLPEYL